MNHDTKETINRPGRGKRLHRPAQPTAFRQPPPPLRGQLAAGGSRRPYGTERPPAGRIKAASQPVHPVRRQIFQGVRIHGGHRPPEDGHVPRHGRIRRMVPEVGETSQGMGAETDRITY